MGTRAPWLTAVVAAAAALRLVACVGEDPDTTPGGALGDGGGPADGTSPAADGEGFDAGPPCDLAKGFGQPVPVDGLNSEEDEGAATFAADELTAYVVRTRPDGGKDTDLYVASRADKALPFGAPVLLENVNTTFPEDNISTTSDALTIFFHSTRTDDGGVDRFDIYRATRPSLTTGLGAPAVVTAVSSAKSDREPFISFDGNTLYFVSNRSGEELVYRADKAGSDFAGPVDLKVPRVPGTTFIVQPVVSADGKTIFFGTAPGTGPWDIYVATRATTLGGFDLPTKVTELATDEDEAPTWVSADGCRLYFRSDRPGGMGKSDIWMSSRPK